MKVFVLFCGLALASASFGQSTQSDAAAKPVKAKKPKKGAAAEVGSGVGAAATGAAKGAADLATLHPIDAGVDVATGAAKAGKDVTVGSVKGVGKVGKGVGHALKKIL
jgi:hypothetical protein